MVAALPLLRAPRLALRLLLRLALVRLRSGLLGHGVPSVLNTLAKQPTPHRISGRDVSH